MSMLRRIAVFLFVSISLILISGQNASADSIPIFDHAFSINIATVFLVNLPLNLISLMAYIMLSNWREARGGNKLNMPLAGLFGAAGCITLAGVFIDTYLVLYPLSLWKYQQLDTGPMVASVAAALLLISMTFIVFPSIFLRIPVKRLLLLGIAMVIVNAVLWLVVLPPAFAKRSWFDDNDRTKILISAGLVLLGTATVAIFHHLHTHGFKRQTINKRELLRKIPELIAVALSTIFIVGLIATPTIDKYDEDTITQDLSQSVGGQRTKSYRIDETFNRIGQTNESDETRIDTYSSKGALVKIKLDLKWTDEPPAGPTFENLPDTFQIELESPSGKTALSPASASGSLSYSMSVHEENRPSWTGAFIIWIMAKECGDQVALVRSIPDTGNNWSLNISVTIEFSYSGMIGEIIGSDICIHNIDAFFLGGLVTVMVLAPVISSKRVHELGK